MCVPTGLGHEKRLARAGAAFLPGSTFSAAYRQKYEDYGDLAASSQCAFLVLAAEVFGRFDQPSRVLVSSLARARVRSYPPSSAAAWNFCGTAVGGDFYQSPF
jgi:hypothetical protein